MAGDETVKVGGRSSFISIGPTSSVRRRGVAASAKRSIRGTTALRARTAAGYQRSTDVRPAPRSCYTRSTSACSTAVSPHQQEDGDFTHRIKMAGIASLELPGAIVSTAAATGVALLLSNSQSLAFHPEELPVAVVT
jgi:hypothetical protein